MFTVQSVFPVLAFYYTLLVLCGKNNAFKRVRLSLLI